MPLSIPPFTPTALQPNSAETFATYVRGQPAAKIPLSGTELFPILQNGFIVQAPASSLIGTLTVGGSTIFGSTNQAILFDKAGVVGEDTNLEWDYTNHTLQINTGASNTVFVGKNATNANYNILSLNGTLSNSAGIGFTAGGAGDNFMYPQVPATGGFQFQVAGTNSVLLDNSIGPTVKAQTISLTSTLPGVAQFLISYSGSAAASLNLSIDSNGNPGFFFGPGSAGADVGWLRTAAQTLSLFDPSSHASPVALQVYNTIDAVPPVNFERGTFDWTTTANVLTIGTQKGGTGSTRNIQLVAGGAAIGDYGITESGGWSFPVAVYATVASGSGLLVSSDGTFYPSQTNAPIQLVQNPSAAANGVSIFSYGTSNNQASLNFYYTNTNVSPGAAGAITTGQWQGSIFFNGNDGTTFHLGAFLHSEATQTWTGSARGTKLVFTTTANGSTSNVTALTLDQNQAAVAGGSISASGDTGGIASTNTMTNANSTTISTGTGTVKMSSANNANNTGWLKCYIGTQVAWIPCWTTNAP